MDYDHIFYFSFPSLHTLSTLRTSIIVLLWVETGLGWMESNWRSCTHSLCLSSPLEAWSAPWWWACSWPDLEGESIGDLITSGAVWSLCQVWYCNSPECDDHQGTHYLICHLTWPFFLLFTSVDDLGHTLEEEQCAFVPCRLKTLLANFSDCCCDSKISQGIVLTQVNK